MFRCQAQKTIQIVLSKTHPRGTPRRKFMVFPLLQYDCHPALLLLGRLWTRLIHVRATWVAGKGQNAPVDSLESLRALWPGEAIFLKG